MIWWPWCFMCWGVEKGKGEGIQSEVCRGSNKKKP
jgi:hypothetical protein